MNEIIHNILFVKISCDHLNLHKIGVASSVNMNEQRNRFDTNSIKPGKRFMENL